MKIIIYGGSGWIGQMIFEGLKIKHEVTKSLLRVDNTEEVEKEIKDLDPDRIVCCVGRTHGEGIKTIDYLEQPGKLVENIRDNLFSPVSLAMICYKLQKHLTYIGTGCIFDGEGLFSEEDLPNFFGSSYSVVKGYTDRLMHLYDNVLNLRIRMPIVDQKHDRNFITKIVNYNKICSMSNSMTVLDDFIPIFVELIEIGEVGTINCVNPGVIDHNEILEMYKEIIDNSFEWENFSIEEQNNILLSKRSNNHLDTRKIESLYPGLKNIKESIRNVLERYRLNLNTNDLV